jgi:hypothetical protein
METYSRIDILVRYRFVTESGVCDPAGELGLVGAIDGPTGKTRGITSIQGCIQYAGEQVILLGDVNLAKYVSYNTVDGRCAWFSTCACMFNVRKSFTLVSCVPNTEGAPYLIA